MFKTCLTGQSFCKDNPEPTWNRAITGYHSCNLQQRSPLKVIVGVITLPQLGKDINSSISPVLRNKRVDLVGGGQRRRDQVTTCTAICCRPLPPSCFRTRKNLHERKCLDKLFPVAHASAFMFALRHRVLNYLGFFIVFVVKRSPVRIPCSEEEAKLMYLELVKQYLRYIKSTMVNNQLLYAYPYRACVDPLSNRLVDYKKAYYFVERDVPRAVPHPESKRRIIARAAFHQYRKYPVSMASEANHRRLKNAVAFLPSLVRRFQLVSRIISQGCSLSVMLFLLHIIRFLSDRYQLVSTILARSPNPVYISPLWHFVEGLKDLSIAWAIEEHPEAQMGTALDDLIARLLPALNATTNRLVSGLRRRAGLQGMLIMHVYKTRQNVPAGSRPVSRLVN
ncbi:hypothetical protein J6590_081928 [Homalodisca vitripennis]|nr:hypothetical protein J6590_081928 [Homalodisca vitripennis]